MPGVRCQYTVVYYIREGQSSLKACCGFVHEDYTVKENTR